MSESKKVFADYNAMGKRGPATSKDGSGIHAAPNFVKSCSPFPSIEDEPSVRRVIESSKVGDGCKTAVNFENLSAVLRDYLATDFFDPKKEPGMTEAINRLVQSRSEDRVTGNKILLKGSTEVDGNPLSILRYVLSTIRLVAILVAYDSVESNRLMASFDQMCTTLLVDVEVTCASIRDLTLSYQFKRHVEDGFRMMIEGGGVRSSSRSSTLMADLRILLLSELILVDGSSSNFFRSLGGSLWFKRAFSGLSNDDPITIFNLTRSVIKSRSRHRVDLGEYFVAIVRLVVNWASKLNKDTVMSHVTSAVSYVLRSAEGNRQSKAVSMAGSIKEELLRFFCMDAVVADLFDLKDDQFRNVAYDAFRYVCDSIIKHESLAGTSLIAGQFAFELAGKLATHNVSNAIAQRCIIVNSILQHALHNLLTVPGEAKKNSWHAVCQLNSMVQRQSELTIISSFQDEIVSFLETSLDTDITRNIPMEVLLDLPQGESEKIRHLLLRHLFASGQKLFDAIYRHFNPENILSGCDKLLDRNFSIVDFSGGSRGSNDTARYLEPIKALLDGIADQCEYRSENKGRLWNQAFYNAFKAVMQLTTRAAEYSSISDDPGFWLDVMDTQRDRVLLSNKKMQTLLTWSSNWSVLHDEIVKSSAAFEEKLREQDSVPPALYLSLARALGEAIHKCHINSLLRNNLEQKSMSIVLLKSLDRVLPDCDSRLHVPHCSASYLKATLDEVLEYLKRNQYLLPESLAVLPSYLLRVAAKHSTQDLTCDPDFPLSAQKYYNLFEERIMTVLVAFNSKGISKEDVCLVTDDPSILDSFNMVAAKWDLDGAGSKNTGYRDALLLLDEFKTSEDENKALAGVVYFLERRNLCANEKDLHRFIVRTDDATLKLSDLIAHNEDLSEALHFDEEVLLGLKTFCKGSRMFEVRFDSAESEDSDASQNEKAAVKTRAALQGLRDLVSNDDVRIEDLSSSRELNGLIEEMTSRRRSAVVLELEGIARFFSALAGKSEGGGTAGAIRVPGGAADNILSHTLANLQAAFSLMRYREVLLPFRSALIDLDLLPQAAVDALESSVALGALQTNFYIIDAPSLLVDVQADLQWLSYSALTLVGKLTSCGVLLLFLRKHGRSFEADLDRAQQKSASNVLVSRVLMLLSATNSLLEPFYNHTLQSLADLKTHLDSNLLMSADGQECLSVAHLLNICDNWDEVEIFFIDNGQTNADSGEVLRIVEKYQERGQFISSLSAHQGGPSLSLTYLQGGGTRVSQPPEQLQTHVQWAVLGGEVDALEDFVSAFGAAQRAHAIRLKLEEGGHPDHQAVAPPAPLAPTCHLKDVSDAVIDLSRELEKWNRNTALFCEQDPMNDWLLANPECKNPRLLLLNRRSRVYLLLALRVSSPSIGDELLPYLIQCFPSLLEKRSDIHRALRDSLNILHKDNLPLYDLALAGRLVSLVQSHLVKSSVGFNDPHTLNDDDYAATRLDLHGADAVEIYCQHLSNMVSQTSRAGQPGTVLWGERGTTEHAVRDLLLVAGTAGLAGAVHVVGVDRLTPRIREVLLRGIEHTTLRVPLLLIFGDRDGVDTFAQYESEGTPEARNPADVRICLWASFVSPSLGGQNAEVWVIAGKSGMGKSYWIDRKNGSMILHFAAHDGFSVEAVINRFKQVAHGLCAGAVVDICFHVLHVAPFELFSRFLHHLLALGLIIDDEGGKCFAVSPSIRLRVYIELPEAEEATAHTADETTNWPPDDDTRWTASQHPFLKLLPTLVVAVAPDHYISIRERDAFAVGRKAGYVASYLHWATNTDDFNLVTGTSNIYANQLSNEDCLQILETELFDKFSVSTSKRVRSNLVRLVYDRVLYLEKIRLNCVLDGGEDAFQNSLQYRMDQTVRSFSKVLYLFIREALDIASDAAHLPETSVFTIRPLEVRDFEVVVTTHSDQPSTDFNDLSSMLMESKKLSLSEGVIPPHMRACVAPAFGMEDTSALLTTLEDCGHLLTPESLIRIMHMHGRRMLGASVIYEGETGVGKSQNLKLYSLLINSNNSLFANLKLHLVAVVRAVASHHRNAANQAEEDFEGDSAANDLKDIDISSSIEKILDAVKAWVRVDAQVRMNEMGCAVCEHFQRLFESYPLNRDGFQHCSPASYEILCRYGRAAAESPDDASIQLAVATAGVAEAADFLMHRPVATDYNKVNPTAAQGLVIADANDVQRTATMFKCDTELGDFLKRLVASPPSSLYHRVLADEGLTPIKWRAFLDGVVASSERLRKLSLSAVICVFVDELNTAGCLGMVTEAFLSHSMDGAALPGNIFFVGAINPLRRSSTLPEIMNFTRSEIGGSPEDEASDYLSRAPYIVRSLSPSMEKLKMWYPNLGKKGEESFLLEHLRLHLGIIKPASASDAVWRVKVSQFTEFTASAIIHAQGLVRSYNVPRVYMSIRNLTRCSHLLSWLINFSVPTQRGTDGVTFDYRNVFLPSDQPEPLPQAKKGGKKQATPSIIEISDKVQRALVMAISVIYWFQLPSHGHVLAGKAKEDLRARFMREMIGFFNRKMKGQDRHHDNYWKDTITDSLTNLFSFANIPRGLAHTTALKENFYCVVLASINKMPLLITGPPGCGKTLSFLLACDALKGNCPQHSVAFQHLLCAKKVTYQCSVASTGPEIAAVCHGAMVKQQHYDSQQRGRYVCLLGIDEAGLTPENRQALKSLHDFLDMREIGTVMMSNTTLDAAKTSRTIQLLQTQANMEDLWELAWGIIAADDIPSLPVEMQGQVDIWREQVRGLCVAFQTIGTVILRDNWFHSRDFIFLCRLLRVSSVGRMAIFDSGVLLGALRRHFQSLEPSLFPALANHFLDKCGLKAPRGDPLDAQVVASLWQSLSDRLPDGTDPTSAHCRYTLVVDPTDCEAGVDLLFSLKLLDQRNTKVVSLSDFPEDTSPTMTTALLAQVMKCIEEGETLLLVNSGPLQSALYDVINRHYAVSVRVDGKIDSYANIPLGSFSSPIRVHDAFRLIVHVASSQLSKTPMPFLNRFEKYTLSVRDALAQRVLEVSLSPPACLRSLHKPEYRQRLFAEMEAGLNDFVAFAGGNTSFYGTSLTETVPALVLRALEDACTSTNVEFKPRPSVLAAIALQSESRRELELNGLVLDADEEDLYLRSMNASMPGIDEETKDEHEVVDEMDVFDSEWKDSASSVAESSKSLNPDDIDFTISSVEDSGVVDWSPTELSHLNSSSTEYIPNTSTFRTNSIYRGVESLPSNDPATTRLRELIRALNFQIMEMSRVESIYRLCSRLPATYMREYLEHQEHLSVVSLLNRVLRLSPETNTTPGLTSEKLVIYTRTDSHLLRLVTDGAYARRLFGSSNGCQSTVTVATATATVEGEDSSGYDAVIVSSVLTARGSSASPLIYIIPLATFSSSEECARTIRASMRPEGGRRMLIIVADMKQIGAPQVTFARHVVDKEMAKCVSYQIERHSEEGVYPSLPRIVFLLHIPADQLQLRPCYQTVPLNGWSAIYVDAFCDGLIGADGSSIADSSTSNEDVTVPGPAAGGESEGIDTAANRSPQWMRVAFSLDSAPSAQDIQREFSHLAALALVQAVQTIVFEQRQLGAGTRDQQRLVNIGVTKSLPAYHAGNKDWVLKMLGNREYIMRTLTDSFSVQWGLLLHHTVDEHCKRLAVGSTSRGLVASVRASHQWLLSDFMRAIVKRDLAADWALEALASLPEDDYSHGNSSAGEDLIRLTEHLLRGVVAIKSNDHLQQQMQSASISNRVDCSSCATAPRTPLYQSLLTLLERLVPRSRQRSHRNRSRDSISSEINSGAMALRAMLFDCKLYVDIAAAVDIIEKRDGLFHTWRRDFIAVTLGYAGRGLEHTEDELEVLCLVAAMLPGLEKEDVCRWLLQKEGLQSRLCGPSRLLVATRRVLFESDIRDTLTRVREGEGPSGVPSMDDEGLIGIELKTGRGMATEHAFVQSKGPDDDSLILLNLQHLFVNRLWTLMFDLIDAEAVEGLGEDSKASAVACQRDSRDLSVWMEGVRDAQEIEGFSAESLLGGGDAHILGWRVPRMFAVMVIVSRIVGITGLSLAHFVFLDNFDESIVSDLLLVTLALLFDAAAGLRSQTETFYREPDTVCDSVAEIMSRAITTCLEWLFSAPHIISQSRYKGHFLLGLLGMRHQQDENPFLEALAYLSLSARCHFLDLFMAADRSTEKHMSDLLEPLLSVKADPGPYIPSMAIAAITSNAALDTPSPWALDGDPQYLLFEAGNNRRVGVTVDSLIFRTIFLSHLREVDAGFINHTSEAYMRTTAGTGGNALVSRVRRASRIVHLLHSAAELLSHGGLNKESMCLPIGASQAVASAIATCPGIWSLYFLAKLRNIGMLAAVLGSQQLLQSLGMERLYCESSKVTNTDAMVLAAQVEELMRARAVMTAVSVAAALVTYEGQRLELLSGPVNEDLLRMADADLSDNGILSPLQRKAAEFVRMLAARDMSRALDMNRHIPLLVSLYTFLTDRLAFRLKDIAAARTILVADAIDRLPIDDRLVGRKLFREFLEVWESLKVLFVTFDVCGREAQAAREIPSLTATNTYMSMLVEVEGAEVHESMLAMMLETRLLKLSSQVLANEALVTLRASGVFNHQQHVAEELRSDSIAYLSLSSSPQSFLTSPSSASRGGELYFNRVMACYSSWRSDSGVPELPSFAESATEGTDSGLQRTKDKMARDNQQAAHDWSMILCPRCSNRFERSSGCENVTCGNPDNSYAGNAGLPPLTLGTCGMQLNALTHRVPAPVPGQPPLAIFVQDIEAQHLPASLVGLDNLSDIAQPTGRFEFDWVAIAAHLFSTSVRGSIDWKVNRGFFAPLAFAVDGEDVGHKSITAEGSDVKGSSERLHGEGNGHFKGKLDVYTRLRVATDKVTAALAEIIPSAYKKKVPEEKIKRSSIIFSSDITLSKYERTKVNSIVSRHDEVRLEGLCGQALTLCLGLLRLVEKGYFDELGAACPLERLPERFLTAALMDEVSGDTGPVVGFWSPQLLNILEDFKTNVFAAFKCLAAAGAEGIACAHVSLCAELPDEKDVQLKVLQYSLLEEVKKGVCDTPAITAELQRIHSLLTDSLDTLLNDSAERPMTDFSTVTEYLNGPAKELSSRILARVKVKHYGGVVRFLRQTLGLLAYHSLLAAQVRHDAKESEGGSEEMGSEGSEAPDRVLHPSAYRERVPPDWETLQNTIRARADPELSVPAPSLLSEQDACQRENVRAGGSDEDEDWTILAVDEECGTAESDLSPVTRDGSDESVVAAAEKGKGVLNGSDKKDIDYPSLWVILTRREGASDFSALSRSLDDLGVSDADCLQHLDEEDMLQLVGHLKKVPAKKLLKAWGISP